MSDVDPLRVLAVDDDPVSLTLLSRHLTNAGYEVVTAQNGDEAMRILLDDGPPIVITDWAMPVMDGLELCRNIRTHEAIPFAYIIIVTAHHSTEDAIVEAFDAGVDDYLSKPLRRRELLARLRAARRTVALEHALRYRTREVHRVNAEMAVANAKLAEANEQLNRLATTDELTGLMNRREVMARFAELWSAADRRSAPLSCLLLDIDRFKSVNDSHGHDVGDSVLKETAGVLRGSTRRHEHLSRLGGEEFLVLCPDSTGEAVLVAAERLRRAVESHRIRTERLELAITLSVGVAEKTPSMTGPDDLLRAADGALYAAKRAGRNRVCVAGETSGVTAAPEGESVPAANCPGW